MKPQIKAYSYVRMSTDIQLKGDSLRRQKESSKKYAEENNLELIETLQDIGISAFSGKNSKDGALGVFIEAIESNKIEAGSYLLVESLDRLSRESVLTAFNQFTSILQQHITIVTLTDNQVYTKESVNNNIGQLFTSLGIMLRANEESKIKSIRLTSAWLNKRNSLYTKKYTSLCPAWLILNKTENIFQLNDNLVKAVKEIFKMSLDGNGAYSISCHLNNNLDRFPSKDLKKGWYKSYIQKILNNPAVYGTFTPHKMIEGKRVSTDIVIEDYFPTIISKSDFELSQARQKQRGANGAGRKGEVFSNIFMGLLKCGFCNSNVVFLNKGVTSKGGKYLICSKAERKFECTARLWRYEEFEHSYFEFIKELNLNSLFNNDESNLQKNKLIDSIEKNKFKVIKLTEEIDSVSGSIFGLSESVRELLYKRLEERITEKNNLELLINSTNQELSLLNNLSKEIDIQKNIDEYYQSVANKSDIEIKEIRLKIHNELKRIVSRINLYSPYNYLPDDDEISNDDFIELLKDEGYLSEDERISFILSDEGQRFVNRYLRYFIVDFSNGASRYVSPTQKISFRPKNFKIKDEGIIRIID